MMATPETQGFCVFVVWLRRGNTLNCIEPRLSMRFCPTFRSATMGKFYIAVKLLLSLYRLTACAGQPAQPNSIRVLLVTGGGWHDYQEQEPLLTEVLSARVPEIE